MTFLMLAGLALLPSQAVLAPPAELVSQAYAALEAGDLAGAERRFRDLATDFPRAPAAYRGLAATYARQGRGADALTVLLTTGRRMLQSGDAEGAQSLLEQAVELAPEAPAARYFLGSALTERGEHASAAEQFRVALDLGDAQLATRVSYAAALWEAGRPEEAEVQYRRAVEQQPDPIALHQYATLLLFLGRPEEATIRLREAARQGAPTPYLLLDLARALGASGRLEEAVEVARTAAGGAPELARAHYQLGTLLARSGAADEARAAFARVREITAETQRRERAAFLQQARLDEARAHLVGGDPAAALAVLEGVEDSVAALEIRASAHSARGERERAAAALERLLELDPERRDVQAWLVRERGER